MALYLVQHGLSSSKEVDPQRGLTEGGRQQSRRIAEVARDYGVVVAKIVHSGKTRAAQTAQIYRQILSPDAPMVQQDGINPLDEVQEFGATLNPDENVLVVSHLPFLGKLVAYLTAGNAEAGVYRFQNSGLVCLDGESHEPGRIDWYIKWTLNPNIG